MNPVRYPSKATSRNWYLDSILFLSALAAILSGIYFLYLPDGGYMGGRNPTYGLTILLERHTWENIHTWGGLAMTLIALTHLMLHWTWIKGMAKRVNSDLTGKSSRMNWRGRYNLILNLVTALSFFICAVSGLVFFFGGHSPAGFGLSAFGWDMVHTWSGVVLTLAAVLHFSIHWGWIVKVTRRLFSPRSAANRPDSPQIAINFSGDRS